MKNWQDYAINADTGAKPSVSPLPQNNPPQNQKQHISKIWLTLNIILTILCILSLIYGLVVTIASTNRNIFSYFISSTTKTFILPGALLTWCFLLLKGETILNFNGVFIIGILVSAVLGIPLLIYNTLIAIFKYAKHIPGSRQNLIFAIIPPLFIIATLILFFICSISNIMQ